MEKAISRCRYNSAQQKPCENPQKNRSGTSGPQWFPKPEAGTERKKIQATPMYSSSFTIQYGDVCKFCGSSTPDDVLECKNLDGVITYTSGNLSIKGNWKDYDGARFEGNGENEYTGHKFDGAWTDNWKKFKGDLKCKNGNTFNNALINCVNGEWGGVMYDKKGNEFCGEWTDNWKKFKGYLRYTNGSWAWGEWTDDFEKFEGTVYVKSLDDFLKGTWTKENDEWVSENVINEITNYKLSRRWANDWVACEGFEETAV